MLVTVYHISPRKNRNSILQYGLIPKGKKEGRIKYKPRIYVSINKDDLAFDYVNYENIDCWTFSIDQKFLKQDTNSSSKNHFYIEVWIEKDNVKLECSY